MAHECQKPTRLISRRQSLIFNAQFSEVRSVGANLFATRTPLRSRTTEASADSEAKNSLLLQYL